MRDCFTRSRWREAVIGILPAAGYIESFHPERCKSDWTISIERNFCIIIGGRDASDEGEEGFVSEIVLRWSGDEECIAVIRSRSSV